MYLRNINFFIHVKFFIQDGKSSVFVDVDGKPLTQESGQKNTEIGYW